MFVNCATLIYLQTRFKDDIKCIVRNFVRANLHKGFAREKRYFVGGEFLHTDWTLISRLTRVKCKTRTTIKSTI